MRWEHWGSLLSEEKRVLTEHIKGLVEVRKTPVVLCPLLEAPPEGKGGAAAA